jgi:glycosyltransferase involved in cell wall biosynthesis
MKILIICTYPIKNPRHGGQLRVRKIMDTYLAEGHEVQVAGVLGSDNYESEENFVEYPGSHALLSVVENPFLMEDYAIGCLFSQKENYFNSLKNKIKSTPDVIQVEHPWLFAFAKRYCLEFNINPKIIYSSHNVEWKLKLDILNSYMGEAVAERYSDLIKAVEKNAIKNADFISCVSDDDAAWLKTQTNKKIIVAPNGVSEWNTNKNGCNEALKISQEYRYALYCASAHPPNMTGFFDMFGNGFGSLKPDEKLIIAGGAGLAIAGDERVHKSSKLAEKVVVAGIVTQSCLEGLLDGAHCIVLPLTQGGGTNLKTAEALWSGKHIVATSTAMRGFEKFKESPGVQIADDSSEFKRKLRSAMAASTLVLSSDEIEKRRTVLWSNCLKPLAENLNILH